MTSLFMKVAKWFDKEFLTKKTKKKVKEKKKVVRKREKRSVSTRNGKDNTTSESK